MVSKSKSKTNIEGDNILYLQDSDAKALGIIEGSSQRVYIDNKEVEVVFVDEHEVLPVSNEDKKIYQDAFKIAEKYIEASTRDGYNGTWGQLASDNNEARIITSHYDSEHRTSGSVLRDSWNNFKGLFKRNNKDAYSKQRFEYPDTNTAAFPASSDRSMVKYANAIPSRNVEDSSKKYSQHSMRNDVFTKEELEIIQNVIDKTRKNDSPSRYEYSSNNSSTSKSNTRAKPKK